MGSAPPLSAVRPLRLRARRRGGLRPRTRPRPRRARRVGRTSARRPLRAASRSSSSLMCVMTSRAAPRLRRVLAGLLRRDVPAHADPLGTSSVASSISRSVPRAKSQSSAEGPWSAPNVKRPPAAATNSTALAGRKCGHGLEADRQRAGVQRLRRVVLADREGGLDQVVVAPGADDLAPALDRARRRVQHRRRLAVPRPVGQRVGVGDEVDEVIRVQVADHDHVDGVVVHHRAQLREHAAAAVQQQAQAVLLDEVAGTGAVGILPTGRLAEDREPHAVWHPTAE